MRTWTLERPVGERERGDVYIGYREPPETAFSRVALVSPFHPNESFARWIVDTLNEKERWQAEWPLAHRFMANWLESRQGAARGGRTD